METTRLRRELDAFEGRFARARRVLDDAYTDSLKKANHHAGGGGGGQGGRRSLDSRGVSLVDDSYGCSQEDDGDGDGDEEEEDDDDEDDEDGVSRVDLARVLDFDGSAEWVAPPGKTGVDVEEEKFALSAKRICLHNTPQKL